MNLVILLLIVIGLALWLLIKTFLLFISIKYKLKINFKFTRNKLTHVHIVKYTNNPSSSLVVEYEIKIDKVWLSSCFINRNVNDRFLICIHSVNINLLLANNKSLENKKARKLPWLVYVYFKYIGGLNVENVNLNISQSNLEFRLAKIKIDLRKDNSIKLNMFGLTLVDREQQAQAEFNKLSIQYALDLTSVELNIDQTKLTLNDFKKFQYFLDKFRNKNKNSFSSTNKLIYLNYIKSICINKLCLNDSHHLTGLEFFNNNLNYFKLSLTSFNDNTAKLVDNLAIDVFRSQQTRSIDLVVTCDYSNLNFSIDILKQIPFQTESNSQEKSLDLKLELKLKNVYFKFLDKEKSLSYILGAKSLNLNSNLKNIFQLNLVNVIVFKSNDFVNSDVYSNRLNVTENELIDLFERINSNKFHNTDPTFEHAWGNLLNCNLVSMKLRINEKNRKFLNLFVDRLFVEHSPQLIDFINRLELGKKFPERNVKNNSILIRFKINQANLYFLYAKKYFIAFGLNCLNFKNEPLGEFNLKLNYLKSVQMRLDDLKTRKDTLNYCNLACISENENSNLICLFKMVSLNRSNENDYFLTVNDILCTWSLKIHFILNEILFKPLFSMKKVFKSSENKSSDFKFKFLIESNILVNFLFDYSQDSSKVECADTTSLKYFNSNSLLIETVSIILNDAYLSLNSNPYEFNLSINDISMFTNVDDQSLTFVENDEYTFNPSPYRRKFFHTNKFSLSYEHFNDFLTSERRFLNTQIAKNKLLSVNFDLIYINFIFSYNFAKLIDHLLNLRKFLLKIHNRVKEKSNQEPLSCDFLLIIKQLKLIIEDDPFEVKLSYNYALMSDEYLESIKRRQTLDQRRSIKENNLESQALELLKEREAKIYLKRSNMIYKPPLNENGQGAKKIRTELFCFQAENVEIHALSDSAWHGRQKCYEIMRQIDYFSPPPNKPQTSPHTSSSSTPDDSFNPAEHYLILWCRHLNFNVQDFKFLFRDYTQPLLKMNKVNLTGKLLGAEYEPSFRSKRQVKMGISSDLEESIFTIERNMSPFKLYYDLGAKMNLFSYAYGPCWEGSMAQLNLSLDKIIHPARDPSKAMPWWDKSRLYLHGRLTSHMQQCQIIYHVSMDPYNRTEEMKLVWSQLYFDWKNMQMLFKATLDVYLNTESKYDDCCLLHLPNLEACIKLDWSCKAQMYQQNTNLVGYNLANAHNLVSLCAPDKIPQVVNSFEHDSYAQFRSENVNVSFSFKCKQINENNNLPTCKFYASTSRFLEKIKNLLSAVTRPTKRGKLFLNIKPRKPLLSRHFKIVNFNFDIPRMNVIYWSSASEQYGIQLECRHFKMSSTLKLELTPFEDKLKRRPRPNWSVELMKFNLDQTTVYLMSPVQTTSNSSNSFTGPILFNSDKSQSNPPGEPDQFMLEMNERSIRFLDAKPAIRNFFMKVDSIYYEREKNSQYNSLSDTGRAKLTRFSSYPITTSSRPNSFKLNKNPNNNISMTSLVPIQVTNMPKHNLLIKNLKAKWNTVNRDVVYILYEIYNKSKRLRHNLSSQALKQYEFLTDQFVQNHLLNQYKSQQQNQQTKFSRKSSTSQKTALNSDLDTIGASSSSNKYFEELLDKLDSEKNLNSNIYCDETPSNQSTSNFNDLLYGLNSINKMSDILNENVFIEFINSQVKLTLDDSSLINQQKVNNNNNNLKQKKPSNNEYLIISAARANLVQRVHKPVWKSQRLLDKTSWSGYLENMQYFATLNQKDKIVADMSAVREDNEYWLTDEIIDPIHNKSNLIIDINLPGENEDKTSNSSGTSLKDQGSISSKNENFLKSGKKSRIGLGLILGKNNQSKHVQPEQSQLSSESECYYNHSQLQLIVSKCRCELYMIDFDDKLPNSSDNLNTTCSTSSLNLSNFYNNLSNQQPNDSFMSTNSPNPNQYQIDLNSSFNEPIDCFTLIHHDINLCSNSKQYKMIMEIVNNLVLYFRPRRKQVIDKQKSIKFNLQLSMGNLESLKQYIQQKQIETKQLLCQLRHLEKQLYHLKEKIEFEVSEYNQKYASQQAQHLYSNQIYVIQELKLENKNMEKQYRECKKMLNELSDELNISISCYKEIMIEKRAINLAQTPLFVQHVLGNTNEQKLNNTFLLLSSPLGQTKYSSFLMNGLNENPDASIDLDQLAQQSILNNEIPKRYEIWFKNTKWKLNDDDGKTGLAQFLMKNFLYTKVTNQQELDCVEHTLEIESCKLQDLLANMNKPNNKNKNENLKTNKFYEDVLSSLFDNSSSLSTPEQEGLPEDEVNFSPNSSSSSDSPSLSNSLSDESSNSSIALENQQHSSDKNTIGYNMNNSNQTMFRIYCKERPPVGIPVIEHLELNVSPLMINLTNRFFKMMMKYFFENQNQITAQQNLSNGQIQRNTNQRHSYNFISTDEQYNNTLSLKLGPISNNGNILGSPMSPTASTTFGAAPNQAQLGSNSNASVPLVSNGINLLPKVQSPSNLKSIFSHHKKPSQSSLKSGNNILLPSTNMILANSNGSINNISNNQNTNDSNSTTTNNNNNNNNNQLQIEDIEIMKQRSANNNTFLCIKIPEIQLLVSYKGSNVDKKNLKDLNNVCLLFPLFEVHDKTWTWLDLINALKSHVKKALLSQALKHKLIKVPIQPVNKLINRNRRSSSQQQLTDLQIEEHEKLTMLKLFGTKFIEKNSQFSSPSGNSSRDLTDNKNINEHLNESSEKEQIEKNENTLTPKISKITLGKKATVTKSYSSVGSGLKKHFLKFTRDKHSLASTTAEVTNENSLESNQPGEESNNANVINKNKRRSALK